MFSARGSRMAAAALGDKTNGKGGNLVTGAGLPLPLQSRSPNTVPSSDSANKRARTSNAGRVAAALESAVVGRCASLRPRLKSALVFKRFSNSKEEKRAFNLNLVSELAPLHRGNGRERQPGHRAACYYPVQSDRGKVEAQVEHTSSNTSARPRVESARVSTV